MFPVELLQQFLPSGGLPALPQLPQPSAPEFAPIPFEGGLGGLPKGMPQLGGLGAPAGVMPFQKDAMMQLVMSQLSQPNFGMPQLDPKRKRLGGLGGFGGFGGPPIMAGGSYHPKGGAIYSKR